ncbi:ABC transporter substrate-binding protein [Frigoribacterium sp. 2-23]|uniref:ABC transporter substrate-binding protein n=1 Tax=Frigoribacterium sp. 2-23 TaxID=3415006 RepID=UPI003C6EF471
MTRPTRRIRRLAAASAFTTITALALTACGPSIDGGGADTSSRLQAPTGDDPKGTITIWDRSGDLYDVFDGVIADFNKKYPDIKVNHQAVDIDAKLQNTLITGSDVPDGVFLDDAMVGAYSKYLYDLSDVLKPYVDDIAPQKVDVNTVDGGIYGVPYDLNPGLLYYNATALSAAGIDAGKIETYDDLLAAARQYKQAVPDSKPIHLEQGAFLGQLQLEMFASQLGTSIADEKGQLRLDSPEYKKILSMLDGIQKDGLGDRSEYLGPSDIADLTGGKEVFYPWAIWYSFAPQQLLGANNTDWRAMPLPAFEKGGPRSGAMGGSSFVLPKDGKNADLAWLFYKFLMYDEKGYSAVWGPSSVYPDGLNTSIPAYTPAADPAKPLFGKVAALGGQDLWSVATKAGQEIPRGTPIPPWWNGSTEYLGNDLQKMYDGDLSPDQVIENATTDIQKNLVDRQ